MQVQLGNHSAQEAYRDADGELQHRPLEGEQITTAIIPDEYTIVEAFLAITAADGIWRHHSQGDDAVPAWVTSDTPGLAELISANYGGVPTTAPVADEAPADETEASE